VHVTFLGGREGYVVPKVKDCVVGFPCVFAIAHFFSWLSVSRASWVNVSAVSTSIIKKSAFVAFNCWPVSVSCVVRALVRKGRRCFAICLWNGMRFGCGKPGQGWRRFLSNEVSE
jgi:hypothetical protein